jgi:hypothetical protein
LRRVLSFEWRYTQILPCQLADYALYCFQAH